MHPAANLSAASARVLLPVTVATVSWCVVSRAAEPVSWFDDIKPVFSVRCQKCHGAEVQKGGLRLDEAAAAMRGGKSGEAAIVPGHSGKSALVRRISSSDSDDRMPPKGPSLTNQEVAGIRRWIDEGARWPERDDYWALKNPGEVALPGGAAANPIDRFVEARLAQAGIVPVPAADARMLLRRAYFDLLGVPPSPEDAGVFLKDGFPSQESWENLVEKLLADPRYGERWARHWLDLVRYGESDGYEDDKVRPLAWRYRDYVVRVFNADKPYERFVQEQLAGDELWPEEPDAWIATGFARLGAWDGMSKEPEKQRQDFLNDATDAVGSVFLGMTLGCARCHDHKYDAISQRDYYAMQAFFAGVKRETREIKGPVSEPEFVTAAYIADRTELTRLKGERQNVLRTAREAIGNDPDAKTEKVDDDAVKKRAEKDEPGRLGKLDSAIKPLESRLRYHQPAADVVFDGGGPRNVRLFKGGELSRPGEEVAPGFVMALQQYGAAGSPGMTRGALARWVASADHPLTARVIVNRVWQHHFGEGIVATPSDFGRNGQRPSHPELLDWLAREFVRNGWSLKKLHRLIMTSDAYRRASSPNAAALQKDPDNKLLWRFSRQRLDSEAIRDSMLVVSGTLNPAMGGPGIYARLPAGVNVEFPNNDKELSWGTGTEDDNRRRSLYLFQRRTLTFPLMEVFDAAPMNQSCGARPRTTVAPQALALFNGEFTRECARHFAARLKKEAGDDAGRQVEQAFALAFTRKPKDAERAAAMNFLKHQIRARGDDAGAALADFCHTLLNTGEFIHSD